MSRDPKTQRKRMKGLKRAPTKKERRGSLRAGRAEGRKKKTNVKKKKKEKFLGLG